MQNPKPTSSLRHCAVLQWLLTSSAAPAWGHSTWCLPLTDRSVVGTISVTIAMDGVFLNGVIGEGRVPGKAGDGKVGFG